MTELASYCQAQPQLGDFGGLVDWSAGSWGDGWEEGVDQAMQGIAY